ncbi:c-type cytochrome [Compostibacter hankyongensis]|uniref:Cytochrome c domain-containing protein n=1 Tax=Compostibacter hankyongensis TaxID=1007089 RepID=A0ABP8FK62_9BACT
MNKYSSSMLSLFLALFGFILFGTSCKQSAGDKGETDPKVAKLKLPKGFHAEHLYSPTDNDQGSWVAMTFDDKGRMIACDQYGYLYRVTLPPVGADTTEKPKVERLEINMPGDTSHAKIKMGLAHGLLYAFNSLYVTVNDEGEGTDVTRPSGLYRLQDTNGDDQFDKITLMKRLEGQGEHGPHSVILSPDKKSLYIVAGNFTDLPEMDNYRLPNTWKNDNLFPLMLDPNGFGNDREPPGGWIAKTDADGSKWELISAGFRNPFDIAFNEDGELFTYDSDMEWDMGTPWYRPTRICHVPSGSDFGYRENDGKWSPTYPDNLPAVLNIGPGSPTNVMSGNNARFPEKYRRGIYAFDWSYGIIYHIDLEPQGASYTAKAEEFISGSPLPLTDGAIGPDGAFYFLVGGRRIQSDLYRVYYGDNDLKNEPLSSNGSSKEMDARKTRQKLEAFQEKPDPTALDVAWPYLKDEDRFIRYAARIAVEHQPVSEWQDKALSEKDPETLIQSMLALARDGDKSLEGRIIGALTSIDYKQLSASQKIDLVRTIEVTLSRMGQPAAATRTQLISYLDPNYPANENELDRELSKVLVFVDAPQVVSKTMDLIAKAKDDDSVQKTATRSSDLILRNPQYGMDVANMLAKAPPAQQIYLASVLSKAKNGWTPELREKYFKLYGTFLSRKGGNSYLGYMDEARKAALENVPKAQLAHYNTISGDSLVAVGERGRRRAVTAGAPKGPGRNWKLDEAVQVVQDPSGKRDFKRGKELYSAILCSSCHSMRGEGGSIGPDLTQLGTRFSDKDILESIIDPSKEISDQYAAKNFVLKDGSTVLGRLVREDDGKYYVSQNPFAPQTLREVSKSEVVSVKNSESSIMLAGLINRLNPEELKDLMAYLMSGGDENNKVYQANGQ